MEHNAERLKVTVDSINVFPPCPKTVSTRHVWRRKVDQEHPECRYCGMVDDTYVLTEEEREASEKEKASTRMYIDRQLEWMRELGKE